ncbi:serine/threonine-protein kinase [Streptomyces sp. NPDC026672]|uniref:serine/threonine-protein kinase n=1 Tax=unclassified Streptomyces TaxID=2593676 RepID=UPI003409D173
MTMVKAHVSAHELVAGRYRLLEVVHRETNHVCWYAEDAEAGRPRLVTRVALPGVPARGPVRTPERVLRTTGAVALRRPGRVGTVIDVTEESGALWTVVEWIDGTPLGELLGRQGTLPYPQAARIGLELLDVLDAAHAEGATHGELSPGQVYVRDQGPVVVTGFGLAGATPASRVTAPSYASPEQARGEGAGPGDDLWALGALLYTMTEGRPPFRDRGRPEVTLKSIERLPLRTPVHAGPLAPTVLGLLDKDARRRPTRSMIREELARVPAGKGVRDVPAPRGRGGRRLAVAGAALAAVTVSVAAFAAVRGPAGTDTATGTTPAPGSAAAPAGGASVPVPTPPPSPSPSPTPSVSPSPSRSATPPPSPSATATGLPAGFRRLTAPEGFSVALPAGWRRLNTERTADAYRVTFGPGGDDPRTLAVTYSTQTGPDPVAVWRDDVQPGLERLPGFRRIGDIRATTYQGYAAADMEWVEDSGTGTLRTFGRGFLIGGHRSFSLRFTAPADAWGSPADTLALKTVLATFRQPVN